MPIAKVYKATLTIIGTRNVDSTESYRASLNAYGETIGEMEDNIVEKSVKLAKDLEKWLKSSTREKPRKFKESRWALSCSLPDILSSYDIESYDETCERGWGSSATSPLDIVKQAITWREVSAVMTLDLLKLSGGASKISTETNKSCSDSWEVDDFDEMATYGFTGKQLDENLKIAESEGRLEPHLAKQRAKVTKTKKKGLFSSLKG
jgi:hypothetical protein